MRPWLRQMPASLQKMKKEIKYSKRAHSRRLNLDVQVKWTEPIINGIYSPLHKKQKTFHFSFKICCYRYAMLPSSSYVTYYNALMLCILRRGVVIQLLPFFFFFLFFFSSICHIGHHPPKRAEDQICFWSKRRRTSQVLLPEPCSCQGNKNKKARNGIRRRSQRCRALLEI